MTVEGHVACRSPPSSRFATRNEHGERNSAAVGLFISKTLPVCVVQLSIAVAGHHPHDLHMYLRQSCRTRDRGQKQARVRSPTVGLSAYSQLHPCSFLGLFWMSARIGESVVSNGRLSCTLRLRRREVITICSNGVYGHGSHDPHPMILITSSSLFLAPSKVSHVIEVVMNSVEYSVV